MEKRDVQVVIAVILAGITGFALATFLMDDDDEPTVQTAAIEEPGQTTTATTTSTPTSTAAEPTTPGTTETPAGEVPATAPPTDASCIGLWNRANNSSPQAFVVDLQNRQAVRVNVGATAAAPPKCLVTVIANDGSVYRFTEGAAAAFPYSPRPARLQSASLSAKERETDALPSENGMLSPR